jgi:hypothetical protein
MGWLELLPLLKRMLPLLRSVAPMLETFMAARIAASNDTHAALERFSGELKSELTGELAASAQSHIELKAMLASQAEQLGVLTTDVQRLHAASGKQDARLEAVESQIASLRTFALVTILLLVLCAALLVAILLRH